MYGGVALVVALSFGGCSRGKKAEGTPNPETAQTPIVATPTLATIDPVTVGPLTQNLGAAREAMAQWKGTTNFEFYYLTVDFPADLGLNKAIETYTFFSPEDPGSWWNVTISQRDGSSVRTAIPKDDYLVGEQLAAVNQTYWQINWVKAFQIAEAAGGTAFRTQNPDARVVAKLGTGQPKGWLWWVVVYTTESGESKKIRLNPLDGQMVDELGNVIQAGAPLGTSGTSPATTATPSAGGFTPTPTSEFPNFNLNNSTP